MTLVGFHSLKEEEEEAEEDTEKCKSYISYPSRRTKFNLLWGASN